MAKNPLGLDLQLLTFNAKQQKTYDVTGVVVLGLELSSGALIEEGFKTFILCGTATKLDLVCQQPGNCVRYGGNGRFASVGNARERRTRLLRDHRQDFFALLESEIALAIAVAKIKGIEVQFRLNTFSDLNFHRVIRKFPDVTFFDYTKEVKRYQAFLNPNSSHPTNYHLTYSMHEHSSLPQVLSFIRRGGNVSFLYHSKTVPEFFHGFPVLDGDIHDLRSADFPGCFVALSAKAGMRKKSNREILLSSDRRLITTPPPHHPPPPRGVFFA
jgi:hypothetical protein